MAKSIIDDKSRLEIIFNTIKNDFPVLRCKLEEALKKLDNNSKWENTNDGNE